MQSEEMRLIEKHPNYFVSDLGNVYRKVWRCGHEELRMLNKDFVNRHGRVTLDGEKIYVASLVMDAFNPCSDKSKKIFHVDDIEDDSIYNLCWLSSSEIQLYSQYTVEYRKQLLGRGAR